MSTNRKCPNCQLVNWAEAAQCERCGYPLSEEGVASAAYAPSDLAMQAENGAAQTFEPTTYAPAAQSFAPGEAADTFAHEAHNAADAYAAGEAEHEPRVAPFTGVGAGLNQAWTIYTQNFTLVAKLVLFAAIPFALGQAALAYRMRGSGSIVAFALNTLIFMLVRWSLIPSAVIYAVTRKWTTGTAPGIGESYQWAAGRWGRIMCVLLLSGLLTFGGMILLIVPGIILSVMFSLVVPVALFEPTLKPDRVLGRSAELTKGVRWPIFWSIMLISIFASIGGGIVTAVFAGIAAVVPGAMVAVNAANVVISEVLSQLGVVLALTIYLGRLTSRAQEQAVSSLAGAPTQAGTL
jgi:hypothetical protein